MGFEGPLDFGDRGEAADGGHIALVKIMKRLARLVVQVGGNHAGDVIAHLHGGLGDAGDLMAVLLEVGKVAADEDFRMALGVEGAVHEHASALVGGTPSSLPSGEACTPAAQSVTAASMR